MGNFLAQNKFPELGPDNNIYFCDESGAILEDDIILEYLKQFDDGQKIVTLVVMKLRNDKSASVC